MEACVELVKDDYLVLSLPEQEAAIGCAGVAGFNQRSLDPHARFRPGQRLPAILAALSSAATGGWLSQLPGIALAQYKAGASPASPAQRDIFPLVEQRNLLRQKGVENLALYRLVWHRFSRFSQVLPPVRRGRGVEDC